MIDGEFIRICFSIAKTKVPLRLSFYYTSPAPVEKLLAKKCCSKKINNQLYMFMDNMDKMSERQTKAASQEISAYSNLGNSYKIKI